MAAHQSAARLRPCGAYSPTNPRDHGYLPEDVGWYRKHFVIPKSDADKILKLDFDGVFRDSQVWLNGQFLGRHPSGYTPFSYDITKVAKLGEENVIAVRVDPRESEGWWYEGGGIYRHVYLTALRSASPGAVGNACGLDRAQRRARRKRQSRSDDPDHRREQRDG